MKGKYGVGQTIVYTVTKRSPRPGPRARGIEPEPLGEDYEYRVDKYWVVEDVRDDGSLVARTRRGKKHIVRADSPHLRRPNLWERFTMAHKFPHLDEVDRAV